jgi:hypothetical protein
MARTGAHDHVERIDAAEIGEQPDARRRVEGRLANRTECAERNMPESRVGA